MSRHLYACVPDRSKTPKEQDMTELMEDLDAMETLCCYMEGLPDIWQTRVIRTIVKVLYRALRREARRKANE